MRTPPESEPVPPNDESPPPSALIRVDAVSKEFTGPEGERHLVLDRVSLDIRPGEVLALLGKSGSGKSTLLRCIAGLTRPTAGTVTADRRPVTGPNPSTAMVFQTFALLPWLTVLGNVELGLQARGMDRDERLQRSQRAIGLIGLDGFQDAYPRELSGGMRQRVGFARALVTEPEVLLMDEPFSALDVLTAETLRNELIELLAHDEFVIKAVVVVTHNIEEAVTLADRVAVLGANPGHIKAEFEITIPRPRDRGSEAYCAYVDRIYEILTDTRAHGPAAPARALNESNGHDHDRPLPPASPDAIAGLADILLAEGDRSIAHLADDLNLAVDDLFPLIDALDLLGFADVARGRVHLTASGSSFAAAPIREAKAAFRAALANAPVVKTIIATLERTPSKTIRGGFYLDLLREHHGADSARRQLETAIGWGRYAELFDYDEGRDEFSLVSRRRALNAGE